MPSEMMPKAWYSRIEEREMRARRPCCIPRSKRRTATLGEGYGTSKGKGKVEWETSRSRLRMGGIALYANWQACNIPLTRTYNIIRCMTVGWSCRSDKHALANPQITIFRLAFSPPPSKHPIIITTRYLFPKI